MTEPASPQLSLSTTDVDCDNSRPEAVSPSSPSAGGDGSSAGGQIAWSSGVQDLLNRTGFQLRQENGQRRYGGPPPDWTGPVPSRGCEVFVGKLPRDCYEDELVPVFEKFGRIYELRLMMEFSGATRGYCFVTYSTRSEARRAIREADDLEIRPGRRIGVCSSVDNCRLFVGGLPRHRRREEILVEMRRLAEGVRDVIVYPDARDKSRNRGFAFVEFSSHSEAAKARRNLINGNGTQLWGQTLAIDWAEPEPEPDDDVMNKVKILYVRNLMLDTSEETLERVFTDAVLGVTGQPSDITNGSISAPTGSTSDQRSQNVIERVKKIRDYAFVHFRDREEALIAMQRMNGMEIDGSQIEVCLAKPADKTRQRQSRNKMPSTSDPAVLQGTNVQILGAVGGMLVPTQIPTIQATSAGLVTKDQLQQPKSLKSRSSLGAATVSAMRASFLPYKKPSPTTEGRLYGYYMPAVDVLYGNPTVLVQPQTQTASQALYDLCAVNGYGTPLYQVFTTVSDGVQMYLYKLTVAGREFLVSNLSPTPEEAQNSVTMLALKTLTKVPLANLPQRIISPPVSGWPVPMNVAANMCGPVGASAATVATSDGSGLLAPAPMDPYHLLTGFGAVSGLVPPGAILTPAAADVSGLLGNGAIPIQAAAASQLMMGAPTPTVAALPTFMTSSIDGAATSAQLQSAPCFNTFAGYVS